MALTAKQQRFLTAYIQLGRGPEAAISAGYSARYAAIEACRTLKKPEIIQALDLWRRSKPKQFTREDFVDKALNDYEKVDVEAPNRPRFLELAGKGAGILGNSENSSNNITNNTQINIKLSDINSMSQLDKWANIRKLLEQ